MHRGNNRQDIFESDEGMVWIKEDIAHTLAKSGYQLHANVIRRVGLNGDPYKQKKMNQNRR